MACIKEFLEKITTRVIAVEKFFKNSDKGKKELPIWPSNFLPCLKKELDRVQELLDCCEGKNSDTFRKEFLSFNASEKHNELFDGMLSGILYETGFEKISLVAMTLATYIKERKMGIMAKRNVIVDDIQNKFYGMIWKKFPDFFYSDFAVDYRNKDSNDFCTTMEQGIKKIFEEKSSSFHPLLQERLASMRSEEDALCTLESIVTSMEFDTTLDRYEKKMKENMVDEERIKEAEMHNKIIKRKINKVMCIMGGIGVAVLCGYLVFYAIQKKLSNEKSKGVRKK